MAPREKVTTDQKTYLVNLMDSYLETKKNGGFTKFWAMAYQEWFKLWPEQDNTSIKDESERKEALTQAIKKRQQTWFRNHMVWKPKPIQVAAPKVQKAKHSPQLLEAYSNQYYDTRVAMNVAVILEKGDVPQGKHLAVIHEQVEAAFNKETPEFQEDFAAIHAKILEDHAIARKKAKEEANLITPMSYEAGIESIEAHFKAFTSGTDASRWSFVLFAGGPDPRNGGRINTMSYHHGPNVFGQSFSSYDPDFLTVHVLAFTRFLTTCYSPEDCEEHHLAHSLEVDPPQIHPPAIKPVVLKRATKKATKKATSKLTTDVAQTESPILSIQPTVVAAHADTLFSGLPPIINPMPVVPAAPINTIFLDPIDFDPDVDMSMWDGFNVEAALNAMNSKAADFNPPAMYPSLTQELSIPYPLHRASLPSTLPY
ncbi:hypothetical protein BDN71DRAFT_1510343 [Pleurotus eryngii]|uniref:Uncharacterized protein n=1 Tax=Pleurotus eryngii TaxID=5323 RepID=A0A9P5ZTB3_PLEER|nr:hypothetical protein BDN71DRAFT_1510343 [Pleurotus eryngii]